MTSVAAHETGRQRLEAEPTGGSLLRRLQLSGVDSTVLCVAAIFTIAWLPGFVTATVPRLALMLLLGPLGLLYLVRQSARPEPSSLALAVFLGVTVVAAMLSPVPLASLKGDIASWMSVAAYALAAAWWCLGRELSDAASRLLPTVLTLGVALNAAIGAAQVSMRVGDGPLATFPGRASGLMQNPVYYGSLTAGLCAYWVMRSAAGAGVLSLLLASGLAFATGLSGSRVAMFAVLGAAVFGALAHRAVPALATLCVSVLGFVAATVFTRAFAARGTIDRLVNGESIDGRLGVWRFGLQAFKERPVFGWGLNHFGTATSDRFTVQFVNRYNYDDALQSWNDPHSIVILLLVSTGLAGLLAAAMFVVLACRGTVNPPLLAAAIAMATTWLLQPATLHSLPIAMLLFGAAVRPVVSASMGDKARCSTEGHSATNVVVSDRGGPPRALVAVALGIGALLAVCLLASTSVLDRARRTGDVVMAERAAAVFGADAFVQNYVANAFEDVALDSKSDSDRAVRSAVTWALRSAETFPSPRRWNRVAALQLLAGDVQGMRTSTERALDLQRWNPTAHQRLYLIATLTKDGQLLEEAEMNVCLLGLPGCPHMRPVVGSGR